MNILIAQRIAVEFLLDVVYFPVWWYTKGLKRIAIACLHTIQDTNISLAPGLWLRNLFVPMFGQTDWQGRLTSVFMRAVNVSGRGIALLVYMIIIFHVFLFWIAFPFIVLYFMGLSLFS